MTRRDMLSATAAAALSGPAIAVQPPRWEASADSLNRRPLPGWFDAARFGIFIHWGLYSVPAFAPVGPNPDPRAPDMMARSPYAEWYQNTMQFPDSETALHHRATYGDASYAAFAPAFEKAAAAADYDKWARVFAAAGAKYVVLVTKHHDGYCLWPTKVANPNRPGWHSKVDIVGRLAAAVRRQGMRFGIYYSGGLDWTFNPARIGNGAEMIRSMPTSPEYDAYVGAHYRELIDRVRPDILWNDIGYPTQDSALQLAADFYNGNREGVINDRWLPARETLAGPQEEVTARLKEFGRWLAQHRPPPTAHSDFITPEYAADLKPLEKKWEATRGIGHSFGYNAREGDDQLMTADAIAALIRDCTAKGGNVLLNIGPRGDGTLDPKQVARLRALGKLRAAAS